MSKSLCISSKLFYKRDSIILYRRYFGLHQRKGHEGNISERSEEERIKHLTAHDKNCIKNLLRVSL